MLGPNRTLRVLLRLTCPPTALPTLSKSKKEVFVVATESTPSHFPGDAFRCVVIQITMNQKLPVVPVPGKTEEWALADFPVQPSMKRTVAIPVTLFWVAAAINPG